LKISASNITTQSDDLSSMTLNNLLKEIDKYKNIFIYSKDLLVDIDTIQLMFHGTAKNIGLFSYCKAIIQKIQSSQIKFDDYQKIIAKFNSLRKEILENDWLNSSLKEIKIKINSIKLNFSYILNFILTSYRIKMLQSLSCIKNKQFQKNNIPPMLYKYVEAVCSDSKLPQNIIDTMFNFQYQIETLKEDINTQGWGYDFNIIARLLNTEANKQYLIYIYNDQLSRCVHSNFAVQSIQVIPKIDQGSEELFLKILSQTQEQLKLITPQSNDNELQDIQTKPTKIISHGLKLTHCMFYFLLLTIFISLMAFIVIK
jgi:hypothetical protein